ncbi:hypothetical protein SAMN05421754_100341 [Nitrosomonas sp. Nm58]|nr:hypothetical protein SAMN05421754_100341 [Nitrosomonas sp. Nm58]
MYYTPSLGAQLPPGSKKEDTTNASKKNKAALAAVLSLPALKGEVCRATDQSSSSICPRASPEGFLTLCTFA